MYIILDPQWLANAFKCIVTAEQFQIELPHIDLSELKQTGKMNSKLLDAIFGKQSVDIRNHKEHILGVIEKFDIIIRPSLLMSDGSVQKESCFYFPCMIQISRIEDIDNMFKVPEESKSTCLCFVFRFLPPNLITSLIVSCLREYSLSSVGGQKGLFKDSCVFDISKNGCAKFLLAKCNHTIELQVWQWGEVNLVQNHNLLKFIVTEINRIVYTRYQMKRVSVKIKWKCETTSYSFDTEFHQFDEVHDGEMYYCKEHATVHRYKDYWSVEKSKVMFLFAFKLFSFSGHTFATISNQIIDNFYIHYFHVYSLIMSEFVRDKNNCGSVRNLYAPMHHVIMYSPFHSQIAYRLHAQT